MPSTRTGASETTAPWESSRTVARGVSANVADRRARALGKDKARPASKPPSKDPSEIAANTLGVLWIVFGGLIILLCLFFVVGSVVMFGVLQEISDARNYDDAARQVAEYEKFFKGVVAAGFQVTDDKPNIQEGVTKYLWTVQPPNDGPLRVFSWQHDLQDNVMRPTSNSAALLDIELGYITRTEAEQFAQDVGSDGETTRQVYRFNPDDPVTTAIIERDTPAFARNSGNGWGKSTTLADSAPPLPPPLFDPKARTRKGGGLALARAEEEAEQDPTEGEAGEEAAEPAPPPQEEEQPEPEPEPPTEVHPAPPADDDEDGYGDEDPAPEDPAPDSDPDDDSGDATPVG